VSPKFTERSSWGSLHRRRCWTYTLMAAREIAPASTFVQAQRNVTIDVLKAASGQISGKRGAAEGLRLERTTLQHKIRRLGSTKAHYWH
jgi:transcriptional regulator with GAF, ATPase, and Fis domain